MKAAKKDANQTPIVEALRQAGCSVCITSSVGNGFPDLVVGRAGQTFLLEVKTKKGKLTDEQKQFHMEWTGHVVIVRTRAEALRAVGLM